MKRVRTLENIVGNGRVAVVDSTMQFKDFVNWQRAVTMVVTDEAYTLISTSNGELVRSPSIAVEMPLVVCLNRFVAYHRGHAMNTSMVGQVMDGQTVSKQVIKIRDNWTCQYCNKYGDTVDHIFPKSRGGLSTWDNLCIACAKCNGGKRNRTPQEAGMRIPVIPKTGIPIISKKVDNTVQQAIYHEIEVMMGITPADAPVEAAAPLVAEQKAPHM